MAENCSKWRKMRTMSATENEINDRKGGQSAQEAAKTLPQDFTRITLFCPNELPNILPRKLSKKLTRINLNRVYFYPGSFSISYPRFVKEAAQEATPRSYPSSYPRIYQDFIPVLPKELPKELPQGIAQGIAQGIVQEVVQNFTRETAQDFTCSRIYSDCYFYFT